MTISISLMVMLSIIGALGATACSHRSDRIHETETVVAQYSTIGMNDDGDINFPSMFIFADGTKKIYDINTDAKFCPHGSEFFCIRGRLFNIAVPKRELKPNEQWHFGKTTFKVITHHATYDDWGGMIPPPPSPDDHGSALRSTEVLGSHFDFYSIVAIPDDKGAECVTVYLYSPDLGLVGLVEHCKERTNQVRLLRQEWGPGSVEFDSKIKKEALLNKEQIAELEK